MLQTIRDWIEALFRTEGALRTWMIGALTLFAIALLWWFIQAIVGFDINGLLAGWFS